MPSTTFFNLPEEKRERLLAAARAEFARTSYEEASVNRIIQAAGIPRGSFYMYFTDKEELFRYLMERYGEMLVEAFAGLLDRAEGDLFAALGVGVPHGGGHGVFTDLGEDVSDLAGGVLGGYLDDLLLGAVVEVPFDGLDLLGVLETYDSVVSVEVDLTVVLDFALGGVGRW